MPSTIPIRFRGLLHAAAALSLAMTATGCDRNLNAQGAWQGEPTLLVPAATATPQTLAALTLTQERDLPNALVADHTHIYWTTEGGALRRVYKGGGAPETLAQDTRVAMGLAVDERSCFCAVQDADGNGALLRIPKTGGVAVTIATGNIGRVSVDDARVYWVEHDPMDGTARVMGAAKDGSGATVLMTASPSDDDTFGFAIGTDAAYLLKSRRHHEHAGLELHGASKDGGPVSLIATSEHASLLPGSAASDGASVAWLTWGRSLMRADLVRGVIEEVTDRNSFRGFALEPEGGILTMPMYGPGILRYPASGGDPAVVYETDSQVGHLIVDGDALAWAEWTTECTKEHYEGKSAWCSEYLFEVQLVRAAR
ncbi:MAG: hypothetical protein ACI9MR_003673 [Myxococcota bacterium]|jgi:hypothetical protein